ncbi:MAG: hypothetical protein JW909_13135 [Planctomycetes bacterium]|nr:hypothetical protein [Planctomycetota bacterium]
MFTRMNVYSELSENVHDAQAGKLRRAALTVVVVLCVGLPRAGMVMPVFNLPLPASFLLVYVIFWPWLVLRPLRLDVFRLILVFRALLFAMLVSVVVGFLRGARTSMVAVDIATIVGQVPAFFVAVWLVNSEKDLRTAMWWLAVSMLAASAYGIAQFYVGPGILVPGITYTAGSSFSTVNLTYGAGSRILSSYGDPNVFAGALVLVLPCLVGIIVGRGTFRHGPLPKTIVLASIVAGMIALVYCNSRAGYVGMTAALGLLLWKFRPLFLKILVPVILALWLISEAGLTERMLNRLTIGESDPRYGYLAVMLELLTEHPEGAGAGIHAVPSGFYQGVKMAPARSVWDTYNSFYLHLFARAGLFGLAAFLWAVGNVFRNIWKSLHGSRREWQPAIIGLLGGAVGVQLAMIVNPFYQLPGGGINFWLMLGIAYAAARTAAASPPAGTELQDVRLPSRETPA